MTKPPPKCKHCDLVLKWLPWTGKPQRPVEQSGEDHNCPKFQGGGDYSKKEKWIKLKAEDFDFCELCGRSLMKPETFEKYSKLAGLTLEEHLKTFHPNGEILDDIDFMVIYSVEDFMTGKKETFEEAYARTRKEMRMPKRTRKYIKSIKLVM